jgi:hypothetical protein
VPYIVFQRIESGGFCLGICIQIPNGIKVWIRI